MVLAIASTFDTGKVNEFRVPRFSPLRKNLVHNKK
jgi:hypothetical protein